MGDLLLPASSDTQVLAHDTTDFDLSVLGESSSLPALLIVLHQAINEARQSTDSILAAIADSSRVATGADGVAIASRLNGSIVCRARSGDMAPALGAPLSSEEGISGACLRTGKVLVCDDTLTDQRVDAEVCVQLGIRSIAVVPLHNKTEVFGILEAFSARPSTFRDEQVESLQALAEMAEMAYASEVEDTAVPESTPERISHLPAPVARIALPDQRREQSSIKRLKLDRRILLAGGAALALLLIFLVIRLSWRQTGAEIASGENISASPRHEASPGAAIPSPSLPQKPGAALQARPGQLEAGKSVVKNAAEIQRTSDVRGPKAGPLRIEAGATKISKLGAEPEPAPVVEMASTSGAQPLVDLPEAAQPLPQFAAAVSGGVVQAVLIRKVTPSYPEQARLQGITGSVVIDATIAANGSVRKVKVITGPPLLATAAAAAIREWRYTPGILDGKAVETEQRVTLNFRLP
jgi:TonB family protein